MSVNYTAHWRTYAALSLGFILLITAIAFISRLWVITAVPIGFLFGFFLQKGDLCGASAFSEVLLAKDWRKVQGLWVCIVVSMLGFAILDASGLIVLKVKPMFWINYIVGGLLFGSGMVLAGGCVSGCLYKAATGNLNSIAALLAMPFGMAMVEYGPLSGLFARTKTVVTHTSDGSPLGLPVVTGIPYWILALLFAAATLFVAFLRRRHGRKPHRSSSDGRTIHRFLTRSWKPWQAGIAIGVLAAFAYVSSAASGRNYPLGVTHGVLYTQQLMTESASVHVYQRATNPELPALPKSSRGPSKPAKRIVWWLVLLVMSQMLGSFVSGKLSGQARLLPKPPDETVIAMVGGFLVGVGAVFAMGCVIGNIVSGWALMSLGTLVFGVVTVLANWITTYFYLMGRNGSRWQGRV
jgi:uncharacterized membrane protein YedE/YeeE